MLRNLYLAVLLSACLLGLGSLSFADESHSAGPSSEEHGDEGSEHSGGDDHAGDDHAGDDHAGDDHAGGEHAGDDHAGGEHAGDEHGGSHGNTNPLSVDPDLLLFTLLAFGLSYVVMSKFAWVPIRNSLEKRDAWVTAQLAAAQTHDEESARLLKEHGEKLASASEEVRSLLDRARKDADSEKQAILDAAQQEAAAEKEEALRMIGEARGAALHDLADSSVGTAMDLAGRICGRPLNKDDHTNLIEDAVQQLTNSSS